MIQLSDDTRIQGSTSKPSNRLQGMGSASIVKVNRIKGMFQAPE